MGNKNKAKGTSFEVLVKDFLVNRGFIRAYRTALSGGNDTGDINGVVSQTTSRKVAIQCKNQKAFQLSQWLNDTVEQAERLDGAVPALVVKRPGKGEKALGDSYVVMRLEDFTQLLEEADYA